VSRPDRLAADTRRRARDNTQSMICSASSPPGVDTQSITDRRMCLRAPCVIHWFSIYRILLCVMSRIGAGTLDDTTMIPAKTKSAGAMVCGMLVIFGTFGRGRLAKGAANGWHQLGGHLSYVGQRWGVGRAWLCCSPCHVHELATPLTLSKMPLRLPLNGPRRFWTPLRPQNHRSPPGVLCARSIVPTRTSPS
jgi:hypothetical protein